MQAPRRRRQGASQFPTQSTGGLPHREPIRVFPRRSLSLRANIALDCAPLRRLMALVAVGAALASTVSAAASLVPIQRTFGDRTIPQVQKGTLTIPAGHASGRVRVIVELRLPPLAAAHSLSLAGLSPTRKLNVASPTSRRYLSRVVAAQLVAAARLRDAIPALRVGRRFQVVLDGLTVTLPATK